MRCLVCLLQWANTSGSLHATPGEDWVVAANKGGNKAHIFKPQGK
jgi:hypothetical protein